MPSIERKYEFVRGLWQASLKTCPLHIFGGLKLKINNFDEEYLDELDNKEISKYKYKKNKLRDSFAFEDLLTLEQRKRILQITENRR